MTLARPALATLLLSASLTASLTLPRASADTVTLVAVKDNTLFEDIGGLLSSGAGQYIFAGNTSGASARRGLLQFDLSSIPATAQIQSVTLDINVSRIARGGEMLSIYRVLESWGEGTSDSGSGGSGASAAPGDATWVHRSFNSVNWGNIGGFFNNVPFATASVSLGHVTFSTPGLAGLVGSWVSDPSQNFGMLVQGDESSTSTAIRFDSRENSVPANRPRLIVTYVCVADYNQDTVIDFFDYLDFVADFSSNAAGADFNADTVIDFFDYLDFVAAFSSGC
ncbi:MAG: DNRLRE domain-containing protein [Planctomycetes bacterium]|nr:DNRLRE domain-containing protein [Planctomycetota bacterium]